MFRLEHYDDMFQPEHYDEMFQSEHCEGSSETTNVPTGTFMPCPLHFSLGRSNVPVGTLE
jgi:hypothetical protein